MDPAREVQDSIDGADSHDATVTFHIVNSQPDVEDASVGQRSLVKMEASDIEMTELDSVVGSDINQESDLSNLEVIQLDRFHAATKGDGIQGLSHNSGHVSVSGAHTFKVVSAGSQASQAKMVSHALTVGSGNTHSSQVVFGSNTSQPRQIVQALTSRAGDHQKVVTKVIIAKSPASSQQLNVASSGATVGQSGVSQRFQVPQSPSKTITLYQGSLPSPRKLVTTPGTPKKSLLQGVNRLAISPAKTPPKVTMIPMSSMGKSPQKIAPALPSQILVVGRSGGGQTALLHTSKPASSPMSPTKFIKGPQSSMPRFQSQLTSHATSIVTQRPAQSIALTSIQSNVQPLSVSGSKFQYVRLVTTPASQQQVVKPPSIAPAPLRALAPAATSVTQMNVAVPVHPNQGLAMGNKPSGHSSQQRLILPATAPVYSGAGVGGGGNTIVSTSQQSVNATQIRPAMTSLSSSQQSLAPLPPGATINLQTGQGLQTFQLIPAQYVTQQSVGNAPPKQVKAEPTYQQSSSSSQNRQNVNGASTAETPGGRPRKPCNCTKSQCLKLYCDCFANGEFCHNCNCNNCYNNLDHEEERQRAIKTCLERNPYAFHPKIGKGRNEGDRRHNKGCNCKRSGCLKNYCECYEAKILCTALCKCVGCKNFEESPDRKTLMHLADAAEVRVQQQTAATTKLSSQIQDLPQRVPPPTTGERLPYSFVTTEVAEATCSCLVAHAEEAERTRQTEITEESMILQEFGRCLMQVIQSANKTKAPSPVP